MKLKACFNVSIRESALASTSIGNDMCFQVFIIAATCGFCSAEKFQDVGCLGADP
jgi:hypothetical protein